jgi:hypothetical protein
MVEMAHNSCFNVGRRVSLVPQPIFNLLATVAAWKSVRNQGKMAETLTTRCLCLLILLVGLLALFVPCVSAQAPRVEDVMSAFALLSPTTLYGVPLQIQGSVRFNQVSAMNQSIAVTVIVTGASSLNGAYGLQIRQFGDLTDPAAGSKVGATFVGG